MFLLGVATGNSTTFMFVLGLLLVPLVYIIMHRLHIEVNHSEYKVEDINDVSSALSIAMMRIRDGKNKGIDPDGTLNSLVKEMKILCELEAIQKQKENNKVDKKSNNNNNIASFVTKSNSSSAINNSKKDNDDHDHDDNNINQIESIEISFEMQEPYNFNNNCDDSLLPDERFLSNQQLMIFNT